MYCEASTLGEHLFAKGTLVLKHYYSRNFSWTASTCSTRLLRYLNSFLQIIQCSRNLLWTLFTCSFENAILGKLLVADGTMVFSLLLMNALHMLFEVSSQVEHFLANIAWMLRLFCVNLNDMPSHVILSCEPFQAVITLVWFEWLFSGVTGLFTRRFIAQLNN